MTATLKTINQELLKQLEIGQETIHASLCRVNPSLHASLSPNPANEKIIDDTENFTIHSNSTLAKSKLFRKSTRNNEGQMCDLKETDFRPKTYSLDRATSAERRTSHRRVQIAEGGHKENKKASHSPRSKKYDDDSFQTSNTNLLMEDSGNLRRPKRSIEEVDPDDSHGVRSILSRSDLQRRSTPTRVQFDLSTNPVGRSKSDPQKSVVEEVPPGSSLLGYDWIAGMVENCGKMEALNQGADYFDELRKFRRNHKEDCISREFRHESLIEDVVHDLRPGQPIDIQPLRGQMTVDQIMDAKDNEEPVYSYTVNERLFVTPLNAETENREPGNHESPHIIKISVPSYRLKNRPSRLQPHRRRSVDEADSFSLVSHCQVGFHAGPTTQSRTAVPADLTSHVDDGETKRPKPPRSEHEALAHIRRGIRGQAKEPVDLAPSPAPRVIEAVLARKDMDLDPAVTARCVAVRRAGSMRRTR